MATTFYFPSASWKPAPISPVISSTWSVARPDFFRARPWSTAPSEVFARPNLANSDGNGGSFAGANPSQECAQQWVWGPINAVSIPNQTLSLGFMGHHGSVFGFHWLRGAVKVVTPAGALRGAMVAGNAAAPVLFANNNSYPAFTPYSSRFCTGTSSAGTITAQAGDFLVIEIGFENESGSTMNSFLQLGDGNGADITSTDSTTNRNPFITFATTSFVLAASPNSNQLMMMGCGT